MNSGSKTTTLQAYNMLLYRAAVHPEFFEIDGRRRIEHCGYEFEAWIYQGGHAFRFEYEGTCLSEVITPTVSALPDRGLIATLPCAGEKDHEAEYGDRITFMTSMQTETLTDHLYLDTFQELYEYSESPNCMRTVWADPTTGKQNLSLIEMQRYSDQVHAQGYHLRSNCGLVLRTQSIFQVGVEAKDD